MAEQYYRIFAYGTLQLRDVQLANYGRLLAGEPDVLTGYRLARLPDRDPDAVRISGTAAHFAAIPTGNSSDRVPGTVYLITEQELVATDAYEGSDYQRIEVTLQSGRTAQLYVDPTAG